MEKQNGQMNAPHPGTNLPPDYPPQYPSATLQGPPGHTGYPGPQVGYPGPQVGYPGPQAGYPGPQAGYRGPQAGYPDPQAGYSIPPAGYSGAGPVGFPVQHQPVYNQPGGPAGVPWMPAPPPPSGCPPGLEYLSQIDQILVHQQIELLEVITGFETNNKYEIKNSFGQKIYFAVEDTDCCTRNCCGASRPFTMRIIDNMGQEVITLERPLRCDSCCCPCCLQEIEVHAPPGVPVGYVTQTWHPCLPRFTIQNERREDVLKIIGPCVVCSCCADVDFEIKSLDEETIVGKISKQWTGFVREAFTDADNFGIQFPLDLDVKMKAVMLGACFLIDFMFFERSGNTE
ncbi:phospholipid scramblase 1-like [Panthera uncia]|uniref:phospholipid scramblase 1-like n=1 Tax=Panthera uncia TaxID=29064 RepID=UPI0020FFDC76|nr:phospholipid scramblase 1-like [Panthera uncia]